MQSAARGPLQQAVRYAHTVPPPGNSENNRLQLRNLSVDLNEWSEELIPFVFEDLGVGNPILRGMCTDPEVIGSIARAFHRQLTSLPTVTTRSSVRLILAGSQPALDFAMPNNAEEQEGEEEQGRRVQVHRHRYFIPMSGQRARLILPFDEEVQEFGAHANSFSSRQNNQTDSNRTEEEEEEEAEENGFTTFRSPQLRNAAEGKEKKKDKERANSGDMEQLSSALAKARSSADPHAPNAEGSGNPPKETNTKGSRVTEKRFVNVVTSLVLLVFIYKQCPWDTYKFCCVDFMENLSPEMIRFLEEPPVTVEAN
ncbi:hypothetical protein QOT17_005899 [Balamuthia mandrillaris]